MITLCYRFLKTNQGPDVMKDSEGSGSSVVNNRTTFLLGKVPTATDSAHRGSIRRWQPGPPTSNAIPASTAQQFGFVHSVKRATCACMANSSVVDTASLCLQSSIERCIDFSSWSWEALTLNNIYNTSHEPLLP